MELKGPFEKLTGHQLDKKFTGLSVIRCFSTSFTRAHHLSISWARLIQFMSQFNFLKNRFNIMLTYKHLFLLDFPKWYLVKSRARSEPGGTRWRMGGEVKGKLANGVRSQYSHTTSERCLSSITQADAHNSVASSRLNWRPHRFKWTRPFRGKTKSGFCRVPSRSARAIQIIKLFIMKSSPNSY